MIITIQGKNGGFLKVSRVHGIEVSIGTEEAYVRHAGKFTKVTGVKHVDFGIAEAPKLISVMKESKEAFENMQTFDMSSDDNNTGVKKI